MKTTVIRIEKGWTNGPLRCPIVWAVTACGHGAKPALLACGKCGREYERKPYPHHACPACGCGWATYAFMPNEHNSDHWITKVGDEVDCTECDRNIEAMARLRALDPTAVFRSRFKPYDSRGFGPGAYYLYERDEASPSGVRLLMSIDAQIPGVNEVLREKGISPLSPTERV